VSKLPPDSLSGYCLIAEAIRDEALAQGVTVEELAAITNTNARHIGRFLANRDASSTRKASRMLRFLGLKIVPAHVGGKRP